MTVCVQERAFGTSNIQSEEIPSLIEKLIENASLGTESHINLRSHVKLNKVFTSNIPGLRDRLLIESGPPVDLSSLDAL